jgi:hypothetical protein
MIYPEAYHKAANHLVAFGGCGGDTRKGRMLVAKALRALREVDPALARFERKGLRYISGHFPMRYAND